MNLTNQPAPTCGHTTDNGKGVVFVCTLPPHPTQPNHHWMERSGA